MSEIVGMAEPFKSYFEELLKFDVTVNCIGAIEIGSASMYRPKLDLADAKELAAKFREVLVPIMEEFTKKKMEQVQMSFGGSSSRGLM